MNGGSWANQLESSSSDRKHWIWDPKRLKSLHYQLFVLLLFAAQQCGCLTSVGPNTLVVFSKCCRIHAACNRHTRTHTDIEITLRDFKRTTGHVTANSLPLFLHQLLPLLTVSSLPVGNYNVAMLSPFLLPFFGICVCD